jgi:DNA-directed RNA polymerase subunit beta
MQITTFAEARVLVRRRGGEVEYIPADEVDYMDVSPRQMVSVATAMIPFLEHDDANRALMGSNMMRQAVPLMRAEAPVVGTGMECRAAVDAGDVIIATRALELSQRYLQMKLTVMSKMTGLIKTYSLHKFTPLKPGHLIQPKGSLFLKVSSVEVGSVIADGPSTDKGEMASRQEPTCGIHVMGRSQLRRCDHSFAAPSTG